jgi:hypothetical protein
MQRNLWMALAALCLLAGTAYAQGAAKTASKTCPPYADGRKNSDTTPIANVIDKNHDGKLTHEEWQAAKAPENSWNFFNNKAEVKSLGYIPLKIYLAEAVPDGMDANCDGKVTVEEFQAFDKAMSAKNAGAAKDKGAAPANQGAPKK